jgi:hypothetical protein
MSNWKYVMAGAAGGLILRKGFDRLQVSHPKVAGMFNRPATLLEEGAELVKDLDLSKPHTWFRVLSGVIRPPAPDGDAPVPLPAGLVHSLKQDGWIHADMRGPDNWAWDMVWGAGWTLVHDDLSAWQTRRYYGTFWVMTMKGGDAFTGWLLEHPQDPLRDLRDGYCQATWVGPVVRLEAVEERTHLGDPGDLTREEYHQLAWDPTRGRRIISCYTFKENGIPATSWQQSNSAHIPCEYVGQELVHRALWTRMVREGRPYNVMLCGPPGCGKTTLLRQWFEEEDLKVVEISAQDLSDARFKARELFWHKSDVLLVEDFDRLGEQESGQLLWLWEHSAQDQERKPMIFATSNHPSKIADAFWRPGRFDQILMIKPPRPEARQATAIALAARFGLEWDLLPEPARERALTIATDLSVAHLEAFMQRLSEDPDYVDGPGDCTFDPPVRYQG